MENVLNTVKSKVKTTKVLAILGVVLILLGLFFNVGSLKFDLGKDGAEGMAMLSMFGINLTEKVEATPMNCWGGYSATEKSKGDCTNATIKMEN